MKRTICLLITSLLLLSVLVSCESSGTDTSGSDSSADVSDEFVLFGNLPEKDYGETDFTVLVEGDHNGERYKSVEICPNETSPEIISGAVSARNALVEERFGVKITEIRTASPDAMIKDIRANASSGTKSYDAVMPFLPDAGALSLDGAFLTLNDSDYIDLTKPYWDRSAVKDLSIDGKLYFCPSDINMLSLNCTSCMIFNKDMIEEHSLENPYDLVDSGKWTLDKMYSMAKGVTSKTTGNEKMTLDDTWGLLTNSGIATTFYIGAGQRLSTKNSADIPELAIRGDMQASVFNKIFEICNNENVGIIEDYHDEYTDVYSKASEAVAGKRAMFRTMVIVDINEMGNYQCNFSIVPIPKMSEEQDKYYSYVSTLYATCCAIPSECRDQEMSQIILEAMAQASTDTVKKEYYNTTLQLRKLNDPEGERMLDLIFDGRVYDFGAIYNWGGESKWDGNSIKNFMGTVCSSKTNNYSSTLDGLYSKFQSDLEDTIDRLK